MLEVLNKEHTKLKEINRQSPISRVEIQLDFTVPSASKRFLKASALATDVAKCTRTIPQLNFGHAKLCVEREDSGFSTLI